MPSRSGRAPHVRPTQPGSPGRRPVVRTPAPDPYRIRRGRGLDARRQRLPLPGRAILAIGVVALAAIVFVTGGGVIGSLVKGLGTSFSGFIADIAGTPAPSASSEVIADAPVIASPEEPYTNVATADLVITIPEDAAGDAASVVRIYLSLEGQDPAPVAEVPVGPTTRLIVPVTLTDGANPFTATLIRSGVESDSSPVVTFILDTEAPAITMTSPTDGETVNGDTVTLIGKTQPRSTVIARNEANGTSASGDAGSDGAFELIVPLASGPNGIRIAATDPAGNAGELVLGILRGSGRLTATLTASTYRISIASLPVSLQLNVLVTDPNGAPIEGARVTFTIAVPGIPPVARETTTAGDGRASFSTTLSSGLQTGGGQLTVAVSTDRFGKTTDRRSITVVS